MHLSSLPRRFLVLIPTLLLVGHLYAELGDMNPTGTSGQFNGNITTAGSYDPYTGNATRAITDLVVPGAVGAFPLAFTRTLNTRVIDYPGPGAGRSDFGFPGAWRHSYQWTIDQLIIETRDETETPAVYTVHYPDGRRVGFSRHAGSSDPYFTANEPGISDRFQPLEPSGTECFLLRSDGSKVSFHAVVIPGGFQQAPEGQPSPQPSTFTFNYELRSIIDPYGQATTVTGHADSQDDFHVDTVEEPAGRLLTLVYTSGSPAGDVVIDRVEERLDGANGAVSRTVNYKYSLYQGGTANYSALTSVEYGDPALAAHYTYQASNNSSMTRPLIRTCDDSMYRGAMSKIAYQFLAGGDYGQIQSEKYYDGVNIGPAVSTLTASENNLTRTETRGDSPSRTFTYTAGGLLESWTDFKGTGISQVHTEGFITSFTDQNQNTTDFARDSITGLITSVTYPLTPSETQRASVSYSRTATCAEDSNNCDPDNPYYLYRVTDERNYSVLYHRDANKRIAQIDYPDGGVERFTDYNPFGELITHQRQNGFYEHFSYDSRGLLTTRWNPLSTPTRPAVGGSEPKTTYTYYPSGHVWQDRIKDVTDPRGNATTYEYDVSASGAPMAGRGLVSKIIHPLTAGDSQRTYQSFTYDREGNRLQQENELRERASFTYDDYHRVLSVSTPLPGNQTATATNSYAPTNGDPTASPNVFTANAPSKTTTPAGVVTDQVYDQNLRLTEITQENPGGDAATTGYRYDGVGNRTLFIDPRVQHFQTTTEYDQRNRKSKVTSPPLSALGGAPLITEWLYDPASNVRKILLPDGENVTREYDEMNRLWKEHDQMDRVTTYSYYPSGKLQSLLDPKMQLTQYTYDGRDLQKSVTYPDMTVVNGWSYDGDGNLTDRPTVGGPVQIFHYDERNRTTAMRWSNAIDSSDFGYDAASRLTGASNPYATITREYDVGGRLKLDRQAYPGVTVPPAPPVEPLSVVSRMSHGAAGNFDIALPRTGVAGVECRTRGASNDYSLVFTFPQAVSFTGAVVSSGAGSVTGTSSSGATVKVNLTGVSNAQRLAVTLQDVSDGAQTGDVTVPMSVVVGDASGDGKATALDISMVKARQGETVGGGNFRSDLNADGVINTTDVNLVKANSGGMLPILPPPGPQIDVSYEYDADGKATRLFVGGTDYDYHYSYDGMGRPEKINKGSDPTGYQYYYNRASAVIERATLVNSTTQVYGRDEINRLTERAIDLPGQAGYSDEYYGYDQMSRLLTTDRTEDSKRDLFGYNPAGELTSVKYGLVSEGSGYGNPARTVNYNLDDAGNRNGTAGVNENGMALAYEVNNLNQYDRANDDVAVHGSEHELTDYQNIHYQYLADRRLAAVSSPSGGTYGAGYDALGRLVKRTSNGQASYFAFDGVHAIMEYNPAGAVVANSLYGIEIDELLARNNYGQAQFFHQDRLGNVTLVTDSNGAVLEQYRYDAYGAATIQRPDGTVIGASAINNRFLFTGREYVAQFGFYEFRARAYHPGLGRFMSEDPLGFGGGDSNLYRYGGNDPVNRTDPSGLDDDATPPNGPAKKKNRNATPHGVPDGAYGQNSSGGYYSAGGDGSGVLPSGYGSGTTDRLVIVGGGTGAFGGFFDPGFDRVAGPGDFSPSGSGGSGGDGGGGGGGTFAIDPQTLASYGPSAAAGASLTSFANAMETGVSIYVTSTIGFWDAPVTVMESLYFAKTARNITGVLGRSGEPLINAAIQPLRNEATTISGRQFTGHALDQMQNRGFMPSVVENTISQGTTFSTRAGTTGFYDAVNNVRVITDSASGRIVTVIPGAP